VVDNGIGQLVITPDADFAGTASFDYEIEDTTGRTATARVVVAVAPLNDAPAIDAVPVLVGTEDTAFVATLPAALFSDADGDALLAEVRGAGGRALPAWLSYDLRTRTLTGTPPAHFNGPVTIELAVSDGQVETVREVLISIAPVNDAPSLSAPLADQSGMEDARVSILLPPGAFTDLDRDRLVLGATLASGEPLPDWLRFDGAGFAGTPPADYHGILEITVTADDGALTVSDSFRLAIDPVNDAPVLARTLADAVGREDAAIDFALPVGTFRDLDGDELTITARLANGSALPEWLSFDGARFTGLPPLDFHGALEIEVMASDGAAYARDVFRLSVSAENDRPVLLAPLPDLRSAEDTVIDVALPAGVFADVDGDALTLGATLADGAALPDWLRFAEGRFTGTPPADYHGALVIQITASDGALSQSAAFTLTVDPVNDGPVWRSICPTRRARKTWRSIWHFPPARSRTWTTTCWC
jgi:hypothetical protein